MSTQDLLIATRTIFDRSLKKQVFIETPFFNELEKRNKITTGGGKSIDRLVDMDEDEHQTSRCPLSACSAGQPPSMLSVSIGKCVIYIYIPEFS